MYKIKVGYTSERDRKFKRQDAAMKYAQREAKFTPHKIKVYKGEALIKTIAGKGI